MVTLDQRKIARDMQTKCHDRLEAKLPIINSPGRAYWPGLKSYPVASNGRLDACSSDDHQNQLTGC